MLGKRGEASIRKGVRQGCFLSPPLFNLYSEEAMINEIKGVTQDEELTNRKILNFAER